MTQVQPVLLMTRPLAASEAFAAAVRGADGDDFTVVISPLMQVTACGALPDMTQYSGVVFTSANGVSAYRALGGPVLDLCFVVGATTADAARNAGFAPVSADGDAMGLVKLIRAQPALSRPLLHLRGTHARGAVADTLTRSGIETHEAVIYDQPLLDLTAEAKAALNGTAPVVVPLFSSRSAARFAEVNGGAAPLLVAAISAAVWQEAIDLCAIRHIVTDQPTGEAMLKAALQLLHLARTLESRQDAQ